MNKTKILLASAAITGLMIGTSIAETHASGKTGVNLPSIEKMGCSGKDGCKGTNECKGKNDCKGKGGCKSGDNGCKGQNTCKGKGGCKTSNDK